MKNYTTKPIIGVLPLVDDEKDSLWMLPGYLNGVRQAGGLPIMLPLTTNGSEILQLVEMCDGFLFTGGHDVAPELYDETELDGLVVKNPTRDHMETTLLKLALEQNKPVLGICRGIQFINVALGGSLYQDIPTQHPSEINHRQEKPYHVPSHKVNLVKGSPLSVMLGGIDELMVNSYHHQAVKEVAPTLQVMATSEDGLVEAVCRLDVHFLWAVQWHPEFAYVSDPPSAKIFNAFVKASTDRYHLM